MRKKKRVSGKNTHKWLIFSALRRCQRPSRLCSLLRNQARGIDPWWNAIISLWSEHRRHKWTSILSGHHVWCSLLSCISSILLGEELLLCCHCGLHRLMGHVLAIGGVGESGILRSQQLLKRRKKKGKNSIKCNLNSVYIKASNHHHRHQHN
jgi:hypothetical protein